MSIRLPCGCGKQLKVADEWEGKKVRCPHCGQVLTVPKQQAVTTEEQIIELEPIEEGENLLDETTSKKNNKKVEKQEKNRGAGTRKQVQCSACKMWIESDVIVCNHCGFMPKTGKFVPKVATGKSEGKKAKVWFSLLGVDFTTVKSLVAGSVLAGVVVWVWWLFYNGPLSDLRVYSTRAVVMRDVFEGVRMIERGNLFKGTLFTAPLPSKYTKQNPGPSGGGTNTTNATTNQVEEEDPDILRAGGQDSLVAFRAEEGGDYLAVDVGIAQKLLTRNDQYAQLNNVDIQAEKFAIEVGGRVIQPVMLVRKQPEPVVVGIYDAGGIDKVLPPGIKPVYKNEVLLGGDGSSEGEIRFGPEDGATGSLEWFVYVSERSTSFGARGDIQLKDDGRGLDLHYIYGGSEVSVDWSKDRQIQVWRGTKSVEKKDSILSWTQHRLILLFPRPKAEEGAMKITFCGNHVATVAASYGISKTTPALVAKNPIASPTMAAADKQGTAGALEKQDQRVKEEKSDGDYQPQKEIEGKPAEKETAGQSSGLLSKIDQTLESANYLQALADARKKAQGVATKSNLRQLLILLLDYVDQHQGKWPESLKELVKAVPDAESLLIHPRTHESPAFIYIKPDEKKWRSGSNLHVPVLYEASKGKIVAGGEVGYMDGNVDGP